MWEVIRRNPKAAIISACMHLAVILFMVVGVDWLKTPQAVAPEVAVVQATVIDQAELDAEVAKLKQADEQEMAAAEAARKKEEQKLAELKRQQAEEKKRLEELEQSREQEERKKVEAERLRKAEEQKRLEEEKKRKEEEKKRTQEEQKRKEEEQARRKAEEEKKRKAEAEAKRKAEQKAREDALLAAAEAERADREMGRYSALIKNKIERNWLRPAGSEGLKCTVRARLIPSGDVVPGSVVIVKSSGNSAFDRSVEQAVYKAQPLDVPQGALFERFRDLQFEFDPNRN